MFSKVIYIIPLIWASCKAYSCNVYEDGKIFTCNADNRQLVNILGMDFQCPEGTLCNYNYKTIDYNSCSACIGIAEICGEEYFKCESPTKFCLGTNEFECPKDTTCNQERTTTCKPCIDYCNPDLWECDPNDDRKVIIAGILHKCKKTEVCNAEKKPPCNACIPKKRIFNDKYLKDIPV